VKPKKFPDRVVRIPGINFDPEGFYIINYEEPDPYQSLKVVRKEMRLYRL
jgi:hypothetical protein